MVELPHFGPLAGTARAARDYAVTIVRNFLYSALMSHLWTALESSTDEHLAAIAAKSLKETRYHLHHAGDWLMRVATDFVVAPSGWVQAMADIAHCVAQAQGTSAPFPGTSVTARPPRDVAAPP